jgi:Arc/MetJ-type ribon-helix-helix transcriptional regulator
MKHPAKLRPPSEIPKSQGPAGPRSIYLEDETVEWLDRLRGKASRSAVVNEAVRFYLQSLEGAAKNGARKS